MKVESRDELLFRVFTSTLVCAARGIRDGYQGKPRAAIVDPHYEAGHAYGTKLARQQDRPFRIAN